MESLVVLLLNAKDIPILIEREFTVPGALVQDKHAIALKQKDVIVGHIPKFLSKITYFYLKHGGDLLVEITGKRQYSGDLPQGGMELPALCFQDFKPGNAFTVTQSCQKGHENIWTIQKKKRQNKKMICIFEHYSYTKKKI